MMRRVCFLLGSALIGVVCQLPAEVIIRADRIFQPVEAANGMVAAAEALAAEAGLAVLEAGGNAVDAGVCVGFTLAVTLPRAGNIGGGGFMLIHDADSGQTHALDYREVAPAKAFRDMFLDADGQADPGKSRNSPLGIGVPGTVAGLLAAHERYGSLPLSRLLAPAIRLAEEGFPVYPGLEHQFSRVFASGRLGKEARRVFSMGTGQPLLTGELFRQPELAASLRRIADSGRDGFYRGTTARLIVETVQGSGGVLALEDLEAYQPVWREPVRGAYRGCEILSMPPPSSGGIHLVQMLNLLENFPLVDWGHNSCKTVHAMVEVMKRAYADRSQYLGDPDFVNVPQTELLSEAYEQDILARLDRDSPTPSTDILPGRLPALKPESPQTTHFSIVDRNGNAVSNTYTLNFSFGSGIMAEGTGILLNNEMDDFSAKPGVPNAFGLIGGEANAVAPGKRMLSSMSPTIVLKNGKVHLVTGSPGGSRIITTVLQVVLNVLEFGMNAAEATNAPRIHHQWLPDTLLMEKGFPVDTRNLLEAMGYPVQTGDTIGNTQTIVVEGDRLTGATDPRRKGGKVAAY